MYPRAVMSLDQKERREDMSSKSHFIVCLLSAIVIYYVTCQAIMKSAKFVKVGQGFRVGEPSAMLQTFSRTSLMGCSSLCANDANCNGFQFANQEGSGTGSKGSCQLMNFRDDLDALDSLAVTDSSSSIYRLETEAEPTTTAAAATTMASKPVRTTDACSYVGPIVGHTCTCSSNTPSYCEGILECNSTYSDEPIYYYLDRSKAFDLYDSAKAYCTDLGLELLMVKSNDEQATVCNFLQDEIGHPVEEDFWMAMRRKDDNDVFKYDDETPFILMYVWYRNHAPPGCVYLAGTHGFSWDSAINCDGEDRDGRTGRAICMRVST